jgi:hypothetical protein
MKCGVWTQVELHIVMQAQRAQQLQTQQPRQPQQLLEQQIQTELFHDQATNVSPEKSVKQITGVAQAAQLCIVQ